MSESTERELRLARAALNHIEHTRLYRNAGNTRAKAQARRDLDVAHDYLLTLCLEVLPPAADPGQGVME